MSYDFLAFCGNVIQLTAKATFPPELPVVAGCRAGTRAAGIERCLAWRPLAAPRANPAPRAARQRAGMLGQRSDPQCITAGPAVQGVGNQELRETGQDFSWLCPVPSPAAGPSSPSPDARATAGRRAGVGRGGRAPASRSPRGQRQSTGTAGGSRTYPGSGADHHPGSERARHSQVRVSALSFGTMAALAGLLPAVPSSCHGKAIARPPCHLAGGGTGLRFPTFSLHLAQAGGRCGAEDVRGRRGRRGRTALQGCGSPGGISPLPGKRRPRERSSISGSASLKGTY